MSIYSNQFDFETAENREAWHARQAKKDQKIAPVVELDEWKVSVIAMALNDYANRSRNVDGGSSGLARKLADMFGQGNATYVATSPGFYFGE